MFKLNLLPWREEERRYASKKFKLQIGLALLIATGFILIWRGLLFYETQQLKTQQKITQQTLVKLAPQIIELEQLKKYQITLISTLNTYQKISEQQSALAQLLNDLSRIASTTTLTKLQKNNDEIILQGTSKSELSIAQFMQDLTKLPHISPPKLLFNLMANASYNFTASFQLK